MKPDDRLKDWRAFRYSLIGLEIEEQLAKVVEYWSVVPIVTFFLDFDNPESWPTPWELIYKGIFCPSGIAYLMLKSLELVKDSEWSDNDLKLFLIKDLDKQETFLILVVQDKYALNYNHNKVDSWERIKKGCKLIKINVKNNFDIC